LFKWEYVKWRLCWCWLFSPNRACETTKLCPSQSLSSRKKHTSRRVWELLRYTNFVKDFDLYHNLILKRS
jgi:hypothetical protein